MAKLTITLSEDTVDTIVRSKLHESLVTYIKQSDDDDLTYHKTVESFELVLDYYGGDDG